MAKCKNCHRKGFTVETDVNGLCAACAPYYYLSLQEDLKALDQALHVLARTSKPESALSRIEAAKNSLGRLRSYAAAGLVNLPRPIDQLDKLLSESEAQWQTD